MQKRGKTKESNEKKKKKKWSETNGLVFFSGGVSGTGAMHFN